MADMFDGNRIVGNVTFTYYMRPTIIVDRICTDITMIRSGNVGQKTAITIRVIQRTKPPVDCYAR